MAGPLLKRSVDLALSWFPSHATIAWSAPQATYCRAATRSPPCTCAGGGTVRPELYDKFGKKTFGKCALYSHGSRNKWGARYKNDRDSKPGRYSAESSDRDAKTGPENQSPAAVRGRPEHATTPPEPQPRWICDQGCCTLEDWSEGAPTNPINRSQIPCKKSTRIKKEHNIADHETSPTDDGMLPIDREDHETSETPKTEHKDHETPTKETHNTVAELLPLDLPTGNTDSTEQAKKTTSSAIALAPPH